MARVVPSQVVELIDRFYPPEQDIQEIGLNDTQCPMIATVLALIEKIPPELITLSAEEFSLFSFSSQTIKTAVDRYIGLSARDTTNRQRATSKEVEPPWWKTFSCISARMLGKMPG